MSDPWSRPTIKDLQDVLESIERRDGMEDRNVERLELAVPAEILTTRGNTVSAMTREISRNGIGLFHKGAVSLGEVTVRMASETREYKYRILLEWCRPCDNGMHMSGGRFLSRDSSDD